MQFAASLHAAAPISALGADRSISSTSFTYGNVRFTFRSTPRDRLDQAPGLKKSRVFPLKSAVGD
jgi:hypothetical protein